MQNEKAYYLTGGLILGIVLTLLFTSYGPANSTFRSGGMMNGQRYAAGDVDQHFIEQMIPHHLDAISMADIALQKAEHPEIKDLANKIKQAQSEENAQMNAWYKQWFGQDVPNTFSGMGHGMMGGSGMMGMSNSFVGADLANAKPFDKAFIEEMIPHHQMAIMMAQMLKSTTARAEMRSLADDIIAAQSKEISEMTDWYNNWYKK